MIRFSNSSCTRSPVNTLAILSIKLIKGKRRRKFSRLRENSWSVSLPSSLPSLSLVANGFLPALESSCALWMQLRRASWKKYLKTFYDSAPPPPLSTTVIEKPGRNNHSRLKIKFFSSFFIIIITICLFFSLNKYLARCETIDSWLLYRNVIIFPSFYPSHRFQNFVKIWRKRGMNL